LSFPDFAGSVTLAGFSVFSGLDVSSGISALSAFVSASSPDFPVFRCLVPMAAVTYLGFLTQYYYFIFLFYLAVAFGVWML